MPRKASYFTVLHLLLWVGLLQPDGFAELTLVRTHGGFKPIERFVVGNHVVVVADGGQLQPYSIAYTMSYVADHFIKIQINDICVCAAPDQKFYSCTRNDWVSACALQISEQLLCGSGNVVSVDALETVHKQQKMHAFTVDTSHIFCVTPYEIIAHNFDPVSTAGTAVLSVLCPPAGIAAIVAQVTTFSVLACVMYCKHKKAHQYEPRHTGCFSPESRDGATTAIATGCFQPVQEIPLVCDIKAGKEIETTKITPYINPEDVNTHIGCEFPIHTEKPVLHESATKQTDCDDNKRYAGPWYNRTEDWVKDPMDEKVKKVFVRSECTNQGKRAFQAIDNVDGCNGFKKGDFVVIDALHKDHLEVFDKGGNWKQVANFDGTLNEKKTVQGAKEKRQPLRKG